MRVYLAGRWWPENQAAVVGSETSGHGKTDGCGGGMRPIEVHDPCKFGACQRQIRRLSGGFDGRKFVEAAVRSKAQVVVGQKSGESCLFEAAIPRLFAAPCGHFWQFSVAATVRECSRGLGGFDR